MLCGNTPTCVGKAFAWWNTTASRGKHPHVRGEDSVILLYFLSAFIFTLISKLPQAARGVPCQPPGTIAPSISRLHCRLLLPLPAVLILLPPGRGTPGIFPLWQTSGRATPSAPCAVAAMARARRRSRPPAGRTERRSRRGHHPAHGAGKVRADAPRATRRTGYSPAKETPSALPPSGEYGGAGGVEGQPPSPPMPRAGQATCRPCRAAAARQEGKLGLSMLMGASNRSPPRAWESLRDVVAHRPQAACPLPRYQRKIFFCCL